MIVKIVTYTFKKLKTVKGIVDGLCCRWCELYDPVNIDMR